ncbi:MAG: hypothetical protein ACYC26_12680 [Phycisphaerales bacterium]
MDSDDLVRVHREAKKNKQPPFSRVSNMVQPPNAGDALAESFKQSVAHLTIGEQNAAAMRADVQRRQVAADGSPVAHTRPHQSAKGRYSPVDSTLYSLACEIASLVNRTDSIGERMQSAGLLLLAAMERGGFADNPAFTTMVQQRSNQKEVDGAISAWAEAVWRLRGKPKDGPAPEQSFVADCQLISDALMEEALAKPTPIPVSPVATSASTAQWRKAMLRLQRRFEQAAETDPDISALVIQYPSSQREEGRSAMQRMLVDGGSTHYGIYGPISTTGEQAIRATHCSRLQSRDSPEAFLKLGNSALSLLEQAPDEIVQYLPFAIRPSRGSNYGWIDVLFEIAWRRIPGASLRTVKLRDVEHRGWYFEVSYELEPTDPEWVQHGHTVGGANLGSMETSSLVYLQLARQQSNWFFSRLDNLNEASAAAIDILLAEGTSGNLSHGAIVDAGKQYANIGGRDFIARMIESHEVAALTDDELNKLRAYIAALPAFGVNGNPDAQEQRRTLETIVRFHDLLRLHHATGGVTDPDSPAPGREAITVQQFKDCLKSLSVAIDTLHQTGDGAHDRALYQIHETVIGSANGLQKQVDKLRDALSGQGMLTAERKDDIAKLTTSLDFIAHVLGASMANAWGYRIAGESAPAGVVKEWNEHCRMVRHITNKLGHWAGAMSGTELQPSGTITDAAGGKEKATHSEDFTSVEWFGTRYDFAKGNQAESVRVLWTEWEKGGHSLSEKTIGEKIESSAEHFRLVHVFRSKDNKMHSAWGTMIVSSGKGVFSLNSPNHR